jgi:cellulose synthase/poly-beta-1,6-N-acetylglucosamine synthase-like glycosyltransferase
MADQGREFQPLLAGLAQGFCATLVCVLLAMSGKYLSGGAAVVWGALAAGQALLLFLLLADSFELAETIWGRARLRRCSPVASVPGTVLPKVSIHVPICNEPPQMVRDTLNALAELDYPDFEVLVIDNNTTDPGLWEPVAEHCAKLAASACKCSDNSFSCAIRTSRFVLRKASRGAARSEPTMAGVRRAALGATP